MFSVLAVECLKLRRTSALRLAVSFPVLITAFLMTIAAVAPYNNVHKGAAGDEWAGLSNLNFLYWTAFGLPLCITLVTAMVAGIDNSENRWSMLLTAPPSRTSWYLNKLAVSLMLVVLSTFLVVAGILVAGTLLPHLENQLRFSGKVPWANLTRDFTSICLLSVLPVSLQHALAIRFRAFSVPVGVGMLGLVAGLIFRTLPDIKSGGLLPWNLPVLALARGDTHGSLGIVEGIALSLLGSAALVLLGTWWFERSDV